MNCAFIRKFTFTAMHPLDMYSIPVVEPKSFLNNLIYWSALNNYTAHLGQKTYNCDFSEIIARITVQTCTNSKHNTKLQFGKVCKVDLQFLQNQGETLYYSCSNITSPLC